MPTAMTKVTDRSAPTTTPIAGVNAKWLARVRWVHYIGALATVVIASEVLNLALPAVGLVALIGVGAATNLAVELSRRTRQWLGQATGGALLLGDVALFTGMLHLTGGSFNPFTLLYLNFVVVAAVALHRRWIWAVAAFSVFCFGLLFFVEAVPLMGVSPMPGHHHGHGMNEHLYGMWVASGVAAAFIGTFVDGQRRLLAARDAELQTERERVERAHRLASLATLAAGAAHELSTPLSTIAVVAAELEATLTDPQLNEAKEDAALIRRQVRRCHQVLEQLSADAGAHVGEGKVWVTADGLAAAALRSQPGAARVHVTVADDLPALCLPERMVARAVRSLVDNALLADASGSPELAIVGLGEGWRVTVTDNGPGMSADVRERAVEPFFTTREHGMGLGLYLVGEVARQLGGDFALSDAPGGGLCATLTFVGEAS
ncbi:MAG: HAMP domain-containing histidine kinase [Myxococcales bacterium]|nr:HAMP domain-containing histidine kinase [Myxococcales bacterium]